MVESVLNILVFDDTVLQTDLRELDTSVSQVTTTLVESAQSPLSTSISTRISLQEA